MKRFFQKIATLLFLLLFVHLSYSQIDNYYFYHDYEAWEGGLDFGVNSFYGDVNDNTNKIFPATPFQASFYKDRHFVIGGYFGKRMTPFWTLALEFKAANVSGRDKYNGLKFYSSWAHEIVISNTLDILSMCNLELNWTLYPKIGLGMFGFKSKLWDSSTGDALDHYPVSGYKYVFGMPIALGFSYRPIPNLRVFFETGITWVANDWLDALSSSKRKFEGVWNTVVGASYQFNFKPHRGANPRYAGGNAALEDDGVTKQYKRQRYKSNLGTGKPRYSKSSAMKKHQ